MSKLKWMLGGIVLGFVAAHYINQTPVGRRFFETINQGAREFNDAVQSGYNAVDNG